jgi:hypothetical protein
MSSEVKSTGTASILEKVDKLLAARDKATVDRLEQEITKEITARSDLAPARPRGNRPSRKLR